MHTVKRKPLLRFLSFPQPSSINHFPTNDRATFDFRPTSVSTRGKGITALSTLVNHGFGKLESSTAAGYRAQEVLASFR